MIKKFINKILTLIMLLAVFLSQGTIARAEEKAVETVNITFSIRDEVTKQRIGNEEFILESEEREDILKFTTSTNADYVLTLEKGKKYAIYNNKFLNHPYYMFYSDTFTADKDKTIEEYPIPLALPFYINKNIKTFIPLYGPFDTPESIGTAYKDLNRADEIFHEDNYLDFTLIFGGITYSIYANEDIPYPDRVSGIMFHKGERLFSAKEIQAATSNPIIQQRSLFEYSNVHKNINDKYYFLKKDYQCLLKGKYKVIVENFDASSLPREYEKLHLNGVLPEGKPYEFDFDYEGLIEGRGRVVDLNLGRPKINVKVQKIDDITKEGVPGAKLGVYNKTPINFYKNLSEGILLKYDALEPEQLLQTITTGEDGYAYVTLDLPAGEYEIRELEPPFGYVKTDKVYTIDAKWRDEFTTQYNFDIKIPNKKIVPLTPLEPSTPTKPWTPLVPSKPVIPWTPIVPSNPIAKPDVPSVTPESPKTESVNTGDTTDVNGYILLMVAATAFVIYKKKTAK